MPIRDRIQQMGFLPKMPDVGRLEDKFDANFDRLIAKLDEILTELRKQSPG